MSRRTSWLSLLSLVGSIFWGRPLLATNDSQESMRRLTNGSEVVIEIASGPVVLATVATPTPDEPEPLLLLGLHGYGIDQRQVASLMFLETTRSNLLYLAPRAFLSLDDGTRAWFPIHQQGNDFLIDSEELTRSLDDLASLLTHLRAETGIPRHRTYLFGYSQGATLALAFALRHPGEIAGAAAVSGALLPEALTVQAGLAENIPPPRLFIGHGTFDPLITTESMRRARDQLLDLGFPITYREYPAPHVVSGGQRHDVAAWLDSRP